MVMCRFVIVVFLCLDIVLLLIFKVIVDDCGYGVWVVVFW